MDAVPPDDDTIYTLLGLLTMEEYGPGFTQEQMAEIWKRYLPLGRDWVDGGEKGCWWGERSMLKNLLTGVSLPEAVRIALTEIPENCLFAEGIRWALEQTPANYQEAYDLTWDRYRGMFNGSALTNAIHVVMGLRLGQGDFTRTIGETVAMSGDNDCTGATAGSILGAVIGRSAIPEHWIRPFRGRMHIYLNDMPEYLPIESVCERLEALARRFSQG